MRARVLVLVTLVVLACFGLVGCISKAEYRAFVEASDQHVFAISRPAMERVNRDFASMAAVRSPSRGQLVVNQNQNAAQRTYELAVLEAGKRVGYVPLISLASGRVSDPASGLAPVRS